MISFLLLHFILKCMFSLLSLFVVRKYCASSTHGQTTCLQQPISLQEDFQVSGEITTNQCAVCSEQQGGQSRTSKKEIHRSIMIG